MRMPLVLRVNLAERIFRRLMMVGMFEKNLRRVFYFVITVCLVAALASIFVKA